MHLLFGDFCYSSRAITLQSDQLRFHLKCKVLFKRLHLECILKNILHLKYRNTIIFRQIFTLKKRTCEKSMKKHMHLKWKVCQKCYILKIHVGQKQSKYRNIIIFERKHFHSRFRGKSLKKAYNLKTIFCWKLKEQANF